MHDVLVALASAAGTWSLPRLGALAMRLVRGDADREVGEIERMLSEIGRQAARITDLEDLINLLRKALDKHLMREAAIASAAEFVIAIVKMVPDPTAEMIHLRDRAEQLLRDAKAQISTINQQGGTPQ